jgi:hypothetical protein
MAGIEKICEYSDVYVGPEMYKYKHNLIQVLPEYRKLFRGQYHEFRVVSEEPVWIGKYYRESYNKSQWTWYAPPFKDEKEWQQWYSHKHNVRLGREYLYELYVPGLPGRVAGRYLGYTTNLSAVKRRLKRLLRCKELNIVDKQKTNK